MKGNFSACLAFTLLPQNDGQPYHVDSGGGTSWGVTRSTWSRWIGRNATPATMKALAKAAVTPLYQAWYWNTIDGDALPLGVDLMVFDMGVNCGEEMSAKILQKALGFTDDDVDGYIGPETLAAVAKCAPTELVGLLTIAQETYYRSCSEFPVDGNGWLARLERRAAAAKAMISPST